MLGWKVCSRTASVHNISDELFWQMRTVSSVLEQLHVEHALIYGSLLGALNLHNINPREVDNDFVVPHDFILSDDVEARFRQRGMVIFKTDIYRACRVRSSGEPWDASRPPFGSVAGYFPYTDIYPAWFHPTFVEPTFGRTDLRSWNVTRARVRNALLPVPVDEFATAFLTLKYGRSYREPNNRKGALEDAWKNAVRAEERRSRVRTPRRARGSVLKATYGITNVP